jgi:FAD/FMN-containing dehydrogenase
MSYGDSALNRIMLDMTHHDCFLDFDEKTGVLHLQSGVLLSDILQAFIPRGWFPEVTPGTSLITVGGAIAGDVHGKNHHVQGCFSESVTELRIMLPDGSIMTCSRERESELFRATCGGMGLTGIIVDARIKMRGIPSQTIFRKSIKTENLAGTLELFDKYRDSPYSVAWLDSMATGKNAGRGIFMTGEFCPDDNKEDRNKNPARESSQPLAIPRGFPSLFMNRASAKIFNTLYYNRFRGDIREEKVDISAFFYPLDAIRHWNRLYGRKGFVQYQFVLPKKQGYSGIAEVLACAARYGKAAFLSVLKLHGPENANLLSFPMDGYSLALDFRIERGIFDFLKKLDKIVVKHRGRLYLCKDARVSREIFDRGYPLADRFRQFRRQHGMDSTLQSLQSLRLGL